MYTSGCYNRRGHSRCGPKVSIRYVNDDLRLTNILYFKSFGKKNSHGHTRTHIHTHSLAHIQRPRSRTVRVIAAHWFLLLLPQTNRLVELSRPYLCNSKDRSELYARDSRVRRIHNTCTHTDRIMVAVESRVKRDFFRCYII